MGAKRKASFRWIVSRLNPLFDAAVLAPIKHTARSVDFAAACLLSWDVKRHGIRL